MQNTLKQTVVVLYFSSNVMHQLRTLATIKCSSLRRGMALLFLFIDFSLAHQDNPVFANNEKWRVIRLRQLFASSLLQTLNFLLAAHLALSANESPRVLHFPKTRVGTLQFINDAPYASLDYRSPQTIIAKGDVRVPSQKPLLLSIEFGGMQDLSFLGRLSKDDLAGVAFGVGWQGTEAGDKDLEKITCLADLKALDLKRTDITDGGMAALCRLRKLQWLCLRGTLVSPKGVSQLACLKNLCALDLSDNKLRGTDWHWLSSQHHLVDLKLAHCGLRDEEAGPIFLPALTSLKLDSNSLTDKGMAGITVCKKLTRVDVANCPISSETIKKISSLSLLNDLDISGCKVTASDLKMLGKQHLRILAVADTKLDDSAVSVLGSFKSLGVLLITASQTQESRLRKLLPKCQIMHVTPLAERHPIMQMQPE